MSSSWPIKRLGDLTDVITKGTTPTSVGHAFIPEGINFIKVESITEHGQFIENKLAHITQECHEALRRSQLKSGDILFSIAGALGRTAQVTDDILPANTNQALAIIRLKPLTDVLPAFVLMALSTGFALEQIEKFKGGVAQQNLSLAQIQEFQIPLPPLPEQQRIVTILDEAFDGIATAKVNAEKNLQNASALFESHLQSVFTQRGEGWIEKTIGDVCDFINGFAFKSEDAVPESETQLVRMGNLYGNKLGLDRNPVFYPDSFAEEFRRYILKEGDIIMSLTGTTGKEDYGYAVRVPECEKSLLMNQRIVKFDSIREVLVNRDFLLHYLRSRVFLDVLYPTANGTRQANLSSVTIKNLPIPLCSIGEQKRIASSLESLLDETQRLKSIYRQKLSALDALKKSLLDQAFKGELSRIP